jgi:hypothetical protein
MSTTGYCKGDLTEKGRSYGQFGGSWSGMLIRHSLYGRRLPLGRELTEAAL